MNNYEIEECVNEIMNERRSIINSKVLNIMKGYDLKITRKENFLLNIPFINFFVSSKIKKKIDRYLADTDENGYAKNILTPIDFKDCKLAFFIIGVPCIILLILGLTSSFVFSLFSLLLFIFSSALSISDNKNMIKTIEAYNQIAEKMIERDVMQETISQNDFNRLKKCCSDDLIKKILINSNFNINYNSIEEIIPTLKKLEKEKQAERVAEKILKCEDIVFQ